MDQDAHGGSVTVWLGQLKAGDPAAAKPLWDGYFARLVAVARGRLRAVTRAADDEEDVALSAFHSFCRGVAEGRFPRLDDRDDLWQVLFMLTARKATARVRHETRHKRDSRRTAHAPPDVLADAAGAGPSPEFAAEIADECARLLAVLGDDQLQQVAVWKMEGHTNGEIAAKIGRSLASVERKLKAIRDIWTRETSR